MSEVKELSFTHQNRWQPGESKFDVMQQRMRENSSEKRLVSAEDRKLPTPFSFCDISDFSQQHKQTRLQEREPIIVKEFELKQYPKNVSQETYVDTFVANILRLAKSNSFEDIVEQTKQIKQIIDINNYKADEFLCSLCSKHKFNKQKNKFQETECVWPILAIVAQRSSCEFLTKFIEAVDSVFGVETTKKMMLVKSKDYNDTALSAALANGGVKSFSFLLELAEKLGLIKDLIDCAPKFEPFNRFVDNRKQDISKMEAMALFYRDEIKEKIGTYKGYDDIAKILHEKYINFQKSETSKSENIFKNNRFAALANLDQVE